MTNAANKAPAPVFHPKKIKLDASDRIIRGFTYVVVTLFSIACIIPFWMVIASSFSTEEAIRRTEALNRPFDWEKEADDEED